MEAWQRKKGTKLIIMIYFYEFHIFVFLLFLQRRFASLSPIAIFGSLRLRGCLWQSQSLIKENFLAENYNERVFFSESLFSSKKVSKEIFDCIFTDKKM
jgi:hypothetical protein